MKFPSVEHIYSRTVIENMLWITIQPLKLNTININKSGGGYNADPAGITVAGVTDGHISFIAPDGINYSLSHTWSEEGTIAGAIRDAKAGVVNAGQQAAGATVKNGETEASRSKNDNPMVYTNTERREITMTFELATIIDPYLDVFAPVDALMKLSMAEFEKNDSALATTFQFPYIFRVNSMNGRGDVFPFINFSAAAITSIVPTWGAPYKGSRVNTNGLYPSTCKLDVTFKDLSPAYRGNLNGESDYVNVSGTVKGGS